MYSFALSGKTVSELLVVIEVNNNILIKRIQLMIKCKQVLDNYLYIYRLGNLQLLVRQT